MRNMRLGFSFLILFVIAASPLAASAQSTSSERPFGGMHLFAMQCTCGSESLHYILDYTSNTVLALLFPPGTKLFSNNNVYATYQLGTYTPGGQSCWVEAEDCIELNADGTYGSQPGTGTSLLGGMRSLASVFSPVFRAFNFTSGTTL